MRRPRKSRRRGWRSRRRRPRRPLSLLAVLGRPQEGAEREAANLELVSAERLAALAAEVGGGGSPVWSGDCPGPGEELALAMEVARCLRGEAELVWEEPSPPTNLS